MEQFIKYAETLTQNEEILNWARTVGRASLKKEAVSESCLEHVIDWLVSDAAPKRLRRLNIKDAVRLSTNWMELNKKKGKDLEDTDTDIKTFMKFEDNTRIVELLSESAFKRE